jgi:hypothetical protein
MSLGIQSADELAAVQDGQSEIAIATLCSRRITFNLIVEMEQLMRSIPIPYQGIERGEQRRQYGFQVSGGGMVDQLGAVGMDVSRSFKSLHLYTQEQALPGQGLQPLRHAFFRLSKVIRNPGREGDPKSPNRSKGKRAVKFFARWEGGIFPVR